MPLVIGVPLGRTLSPTRLKTTSYFAIAMFIIHARRP